MSEWQLDSIESAIAAIKDGRPVVVIDDEDRENEGDL
ncbi:MAG TPA: 3,4-dihydroxy-2-butanone-4-phosphate synthase, partial [Modestobacter sp.]|nr:3,4-dihydroxy-2-butanone-4-phosphate synthase [Modestobacter sp.]